MLGNFGSELGSSARAISAGLRNQAQNEVVSAGLGIAGDSHAGVFGRLRKLLQLELGKRQVDILIGIGGVNADGALQVVFSGLKLRGLVVSESKMVSRAPEVGIAVENFKIKRDGAGRLIRIQKST